MFGTPLYVRVVPQERGRGWMLLVSWEKPVVQRTCTQLMTMSGVTRESYERQKQQVMAYYNVKSVEDVTPDNVKKQLEKEFAAQEAAAPPAAAE